MVVVVVQLLVVVAVVIMIGNYSTEIQHAIHPFPITLWEFSSEHQLDKAFLTSEDFPEYFSHAHMLSISHSSLPLQIDNKLTKY